MTKRGGRESDIRERSTEVGERTTVPERTRKDAAANPAARTPSAEAVHRSYEYEDPERARLKLDLIQARERIRELEADIAREKE